MKTMTLTNRILAVAIASAVLMTGCFRDPASNEDRAPSGSGARVEGQVQGDFALAKRASGNGGVEGATVTLMKVKADGSLEAVHGAEVKTGADGKFSIEAAVEAGVEGARGLVVVAKKEAKEWKAVVSSEIKEGTAAKCRPLDVETSVEADVYAKVKGSAEGAAVSFADIASHVDASMAAKASGSAEVKDYIAAQMGMEADIRASVLAKGAAKVTLEQMAKADAARLDAQAKLEAALAAASDASVEAKAEAQAKAEADLRGAQAGALASAGIAIGEFAKAREAAYQAMVKASADVKVEADAKVTWLRRISLQHAITLETAVQEDIKASGGAASIALAAGTALKASLGSVTTSVECDSAFAKYRRSIGAEIKAWAESSIGTKISLSDSSKARAELKAGLQAATSSGMVADAYTKFYADAEAELKASLGAVLGVLEKSKVEAMVRTGLLIGIEAGTQGGTSVKTGTSISGKVEGNVSGSEVTLAQLKPDGSLEIITEVTATTDANGEFTLKTDKVLPESVIVIVTARDSSKLTTVIDSKVEEAVDVTTETTVETDIIKQTVKDGNTEVTPDVIKANVDSTVAASVKGNDSAMAALITSLETAAKVETRFLTDGSVGLATASLVLISSARTTAQTKLQADLKAASGASAEVKAAYEAYHNSLVEAYSKAGIDASAYARSQQVYAQALTRHGFGLAAEAKLALVRGAHAQACRGLRSAMEAQVKASGASEAHVKALAEAGASAQTSVEAAVSVEAIAAAYETYHAAALVAVRGAFVLQSMAIEAIDAKIRASDGARAELMASIKNEVNAEAIAKAHVDFADKVEAAVKTSFSGGLGGPTDAQIKIITQAMILANMCG